MELQIAKNKKSGFTMAETLMAVAIISIVFGAMTAGISIVIGVYQKINLRSEAETLLGTAIEAVGKELRGAESVFEVSESSSSSHDGIWYVCSDTRYEEKLRNAEGTDATKGIQVVYKETASLRSYPLLTDATETTKLKTYIDYTYDENTHNFTVTVAVYEKDADIIADEAIVKQVVIYHQYSYPRGKTGE